MGEPAIPLTNVPAEEDLPRKFGRLHLLRLVARGGMGDVFLAATTGIEGAERPVIVKTIRRDHVHDTSFVARFLDEARVQAQLQHPGVAQVLEAATDEAGEPYTVVEYIEGRSLADVRQRATQLGTKVGWPEAAAIVLEIAQALSHVHERCNAEGAPLGIVHRDLSPQNVMVSYQGEVKLIDFGTARGHNRRCRTVAGVVFAKPGYVAPEVARQEVGDARIDLFALGIIFWELARGARFFSGNPQQHIEDAASGKLWVPRLAHEIGAPPLLDEIIAKLVANSPDDRYPSASRIIPDLSKLLALAPAARPGDRGVRARTTALMQRLWAGEPQKSRAEFGRLLTLARTKLSVGKTPSAPHVMAPIAERMAPKDPSMLAGTPFKLRRKIGEGASGLVWEAEHLELRRSVAVKLLADENAASEEQRARFRNEARALARVSGAYVPALYDFGRSVDGRVFLAMELLSGESLDKRLAREKTLPWKECARIGIEVTRALSTVHSAGLVHRDLKPHNLYLCADGTVRLIDFGIAKPIDGSSKTEDTAFGFFGTPEYMAPEQAANLPVDGRADIYSLGCVLYELACGSVPFEGSSAAKVMGLHLRADVPPLTAKDGTPIPREFEQALMRALCKDPEGRYPSARAFRQALVEAMTAKERAAKRTQSRILSTAATVMGVVLAGAVGLLVARGNPEPLRRALGQTEATPLATGPTATPSALPPGAPAAESPRSPEPEVKKASHLANLDALLASTASSRTHRAKALSDARSRAKEQAADREALKAWAIAALAAGQPKEAKRAGTLWAQKDTGIEPRLFLATVLDTQGRTSEARQLLRDWMASHPDSADARELLARLDNERSPRAGVAAVR